MQAWWAREIHAINHHRSTINSVRIRVICLHPRSKFTVESMRTILGLRRSFRRAGCPPRHEAVYWLAAPGVMAVVSVQSVPALFESCPFGRRLSE